MLRRWRVAGAVTVPCREFDVVRLTRMSEDHSVETLVISELSEHANAESFFIHFCDRGQTIRRPGHAHDTARIHSAITIAGSMKPRHQLGRSFDDLIRS
jgi:hypothetical protein